MCSIIYQIILIILLIFFIIMVSILGYRLVTYSCDNFKNKFLKDYMKDHIEAHKIKYNGMKGNKNEQSLIHKIELYTNEIN